MRTLTKTEVKVSLVGKTFNLFMNLRSKVALFKTGSTESVILPFSSRSVFWKKQNSHFSFFTRKKEKILRFNGKAAVLICCLKVGKGKREGRLLILRE